MENILDIGFNGIQINSKKSWHAPYKYATRALVFEATKWIKGLFGTAHNSFMSCYELFFLPNTYFQNSFMGEAVFPSSHKDIS